MAGDYSTHIDTKTKQPIADLVEQEWFRRYPRPSRVIFDQGGELDNHVVSKARNGQSP